MSRRTSTIIHFVRFNTTQCQRRRHSALSSWYPLMSAVTRLNCQRSSQLWPISRPALSLSAWLNLILCMRTRHLILTSWLTPGINLIARALRKFSLIKSRNARIPSPHSANAILSPSLNFPPVTHQRVWWRFGSAEPDVLLMDFECLSVPCNTNCTNHFVIDGNLRQLHSN